MKYNNENGSVETTLLGLLFSLSFSSIVIAFLLMQAYGVQVTGNYAPISMPDGGVISPLQNYQTNQINDNVNYVSKFGSTWVYVPNVGRVLSNDGLSYMALKGVQPVNDVYTINYQINNSVLSDYAIILRYTNGDLNQLVVNVKADGYHIPRELPVGSYDAFYFPRVNANQNSDVHIKTVYNDKLGTLDWYEDGSLIFSASGLPSELPFITLTRFFAGVGSSTKNFAVESINAGSLIADATNIVQQIGAFIDVLAKIVLWNVDSQFLPLELNLIFIKTQLAGVIICAIVIARG
jgi:hypothetical protein